MKFRTHYNFVPICADITQLQRVKFVMKRGQATRNEMGQAAGR